MNETMKARVLTLNNYEYSHVGKRHIWMLNGKGIASDATRHFATNQAWQHLQDSKQAQEALEAQRAQDADDLAGKEAYEDVKAEEKPKAKFQVGQEFRSKITGVIYRVSDVFVDGGGFYYPCRSVDGGRDSLINVWESSIEGFEIIEDTKTALRQQIEALKAENLRLEAKSVLYQRALQTLYEDTASWSLDRMRRFAKTAMNPTNEAIEADLQDLQDAFDFHKSLQAPAPTAQAVSEVAPVPKTPVPTRCRVNWNQRGFSSGSYPVLGYSLEKQSYILDISTDCSRAMPKTVKMADCESAS